MILFLCELLSTWIVLTMTLFGVGSLVLRLSRTDPLTVQLTDRFVAGVCGTSLTLCVWHLFLPVNSFAVALIALLAVLGVAADFRHLRYSLGKGLIGDRWQNIWLAAIVLLAAWASAGTCEHYDTGLYGAATLRWIKTFPVVPGLANLHSRLGFNSTIFLLYAAIDHGWWIARSQHVMNGLLLTAFAAGRLRSLLRLWRDPVSASAADVFEGTLLLPLLPWLSLSLVSLQTDFPVLVLALWCASAVARLLECPRAMRGNRATLIALALATLVTMKLSTIVLAIGLGVLVVANLKDSIAPLKMASVAAATLLPWMTRGIILSGYAFFPNRLISIPCDWWATRSAIEEGNGIRIWARVHTLVEADAEGIRWIGRWMQLAIHDRQNFVVPMGFAIFALLLQIAFHRRRGLLDVLLLPTGAALLFWFYAAPDPRFAIFNFWIGIAALLARISPEQLTARRWRLGIVFCVMIALLSPISRLTRHIFVSRATANEPMPSGIVTLVTNRHGVSAYAPTSGDQCWDSPLPSTPALSEIEFRGKTLATGFRDATKN